MFQPSITIANLLLQETGTYETQFSRPYEAVNSGYALDALGRRVEDITRTNPLAKINGSLIAGMTGHLVTPSATPGHELVIPHGWNERRLRFILEVHSETRFGTEIYFFQGYSEYFGVSVQGSIDPNMVFYINSYMRINRAQDYSGLGTAGFRDVVAETAQVINGRFHSTNANHVYGLRPEDLFTGVQSNYLSGMMRTIGDGNVLDDRIDRSTDVFNSQRGNAIPSNFLSKVIDVYRSSTSLADFGQGTEDIYSRAIQNAYEKGPYENPFIRTLSSSKGMTDVTYFNMNDLAMIDPSVNQRTYYQALAPTLRLHNAGEAETWNQVNLETQMAAIVSNAVSGLMVECMIVSIGFESTNMTLNQVCDTRIWENSYQGVTNANAEQFIDNFVRRFEMEVMPDLTQNNTIPVHVTVLADLYGETHIHLSVDGKPMIPYVTPSFSDALMAPVVTTDNQGYHNLVSGIEEIVQATTANTSLSQSNNLAPI